VRLVWDQEVVGSNPTTPTRYGYDMYSKKLGKSTTVSEYFTNNSHNLVFNEYYGFQVADVPMDIVLGEEVLRKIDSEFAINLAGIVKLERNRCYKWHQDAKRGVSINMLLSSGDSHCLFGSDSESDDQYKITELKYEPETFYLFNNQIMHTVINFDKPRYLFTVEFVKDKDELTYSDVFMSL
jgi:hypothetical protein